MQLETVMGGENVVCRDDRDRRVQMNWIEHVLNKLRDGREGYHLDF